MLMLSGIDPGWKNLGFARIWVEGAGTPEETVKLLDSSVLDPSQLGVVGTIEEMRTRQVFGSQYLSMERYVPYSGQQNPDSERILMVTGACFLAMGSDDRVLLRRAIDWKVALCKHLVKTRGFRNPSPISKLDKTFSLAAARCLFEQDFPTDHEADAACIAYLPLTQGALSKIGTQ